MTTKELLIKDYRKSKKDLGSYALDWMNQYDDICYELVLVDCTSYGAKTRGTIIVSDLEKISDAIRFYQIEGDYRIRVVDTQKEFFLLLCEIRDEISRGV